MQLIAGANDINIYNLSAGKSVPEWLSAEKKRKAEKVSQDGLPNQLDLIQDLTMPDVSTLVQMTPDAQNIFVAGTYKPRLKCYDVSHMSEKFERCIDYEIIKMHVLSDDFEKVILLEEDRYVEFHVKYGRYYRTRIPCFGRDIAFHTPSAQLFIAASGKDIYRLSLEQGQFMSPLVSEGSSVTSCALNPEHYLFVAATDEAKIEAYDPRAQKRVALLDCLQHLPTPLGRTSSFPTVSTLKFKDALHLAVGNNCGQILMYDIRSNRPYLIKDHQYGFPIKTIDFSNHMNLVLSMDSKIVKLWDCNQGTPYASIEPGVDLNDLCVIPNSGVMFMANESQKVQTYFVPSLGPAPKWCSFLDNYADELQETEGPSVYDDYKFVTKEELDSLGMSNLIGSSLLRAYMHGYFMDIRLYTKAQAIVQPHSYDEFKAKKVREMVDRERSAKSLAVPLPKVNTHLAKRLIADKLAADQVKVKSKVKAKAKSASNVLVDDRFGDLFKNKDFQVDEESEEFRLINPALSKLHSEKDNRRQKLLDNKFTRLAEESEDEDQIEPPPVVVSQKKNKRNKPNVEQIEDSASTSEKKSNMHLYELSHGEEFGGWMNELVKSNKNKDERNLPLQERIDADVDGIETDELADGGRQMTFTNETKSHKLTKKVRAIQHIKERKEARRKPDYIMKKTLKKLPVTFKK